MPTRKAPQIVIDEPEPQIEEQPKKDVFVACGHVNKQFYNTDGVLEDLVCELEKGHPPVLIRTEKIKQDSGQVNIVPIYAVVHSAEYEYKKADVVPPLKQRVAGQPITYVIAKKQGEWLDAAGVPARQQTPE